MATPGPGIGPGSEPVVWGGALTALIVASIPVLRAFHVNLSEDQANAILGILAPVIAVGTLFVRSVTTPSATAVPRDKAETAIAVAAANPPGAPVPTLK